ncbi:MAG: creatininase family protein [Dehalococcoidia bacterium]
MTKYRYEDLTWPEVNEAVEAGKIPILPVGTMEQHGPHLPIKMDRWTATAVADEAARQRPDRLLTMPPVAYGYTTHVMDFPGSVTIHHETFIRYVVDILKSMAYHGFGKILVINGHGSNMPPLDLACRRANIETEAEVALTSWWNLTTADPEFSKKWRESHFPGGCAHACEAETSFGLHLDADIIQMDKAKNEEIDFHSQESKYRWVDLWAAGPVSLTSHTSEYTQSGTCGEPELATPEKGKLLFDESVKNLVGFADEWAAAPAPSRTDHHAVRPLSDLPG